MYCNFGIQAIAYSVGEQRIPASQFSGQMASQNLDFAGYGAETLCRTLRASLDLATDACQQLFSEADCDPATIDLIVYCHSRIPDIFGVNNATELAARLGIPRTRVVQVSFSCVGVMGMFEQAQLFFSGVPEMQKILIVTSDRVPNDFNFINLYSHGAAAALLTRSAAWQVLYNDIQNDGRYARLIPAVGGSTQPEPVDLVKNAYPEDILSLIEGLNTASKTIGAGQYRTALEALDLPPTQLDRTITLNISRSLLIKAMERQEVPESNLFLDNIPRLHHIGAADILINLKDYLASAPQAQTLRLYALGLGHFWGTSILRKI